MWSRNFGTVLLTAAAVAGFAVPSVAQDSVGVGQQPGRHVVQSGETLWGLARLYLGDPLLWPEIYRLNTAVVEDPHWIFPGEELLLAVADQTNVTVPLPAEQPAQLPAQPAQLPVQPPAEQPAGAAQPPVAQPPAVEAPPEGPALPPPPAPSGPTVFARAPRSTAGPSVSISANDSYRALRPGDFYAAGFLTEGEALPWAEVLGNADIAAPRGTTGSSGMIYQTMRIRAPQGANYQVGDSLFTARLSREVPGFGQIVYPTGIVRVTSVEGRDVQAQVLAQFGRVAGGQVALPVEPFKDPGTTRPTAVADGIQGNIIAMRDIHPVPNQYDVVFINLGRNAGLVPGDVFEVLPPPGAVPEGSEMQTLAEAKVVHVRERSATAIVSEIYTLGIRTTGEHAAGVPVRLIKKMPS